MSKQVTITTRKKISDANLYQGDITISNGTTADLSKYIKLDANNDFNLPANLNVAGDVRFFADGGVQPSWWDNLSNIVDNSTIFYIDGVLSGSSAGVSSWNDLTDKPSTFPPSTHSHTISNITSLQTTLDGKASTSHSHTIGDVTSLQTALDGKSSTSHNHSGTYEPVFSKNTGFNKNLGTITGTVSEGNHNHSSTYLGITATACNSDKLDNIDSSQFVRKDVTNQTSSFPSNCLIFNYASTTNIDYIRNDDATNTYHFVHDAAAGAVGNSTVCAEIFKATCFCGVSQNAICHNGLLTTQLIRSDVADVVNGGLRYADNVCATFGNSNDMRILHDGSHSNICHSGTGNLYITSNNHLYLRNNSEIAIAALENSCTELRFSNSAKFKTITDGTCTIGNQYVSGDITFNSDSRLKCDVCSLSPIAEQEKLMKINPVQYKFIDDENKENKTGVIAQQLEIIYPDLVSNKSEYKSVNYVKLIPSMISTIQQQQKELNNLKKIVYNNG